MFFISDRQLMELSKYRMIDFINRMILYLKNDFSYDTKDMDEKDLRSFVQYGIDKAKNYAIDIEIDISKYLALMIKHGKDFDQLPWAKNIFKYGNQETMIDELESTSEEMLNVNNNQN